ncbi:MAG: sarcosine oxidase subunit beta family protein [Alphaproteobacteria bacterium]|nr:sarcosine oxidase subunit beta family protein [Alphaproteobacteria bacterium]
MRYSLLSLVRNALSGHRHWRPAWRDAAPKPAYDVVIVGGGGHGLATAYYLARLHGIGRVAVLEKGWIGGGNTGRNTTIIRSNYFLPANAHFYEHALKLWEGLSRELNYNIMFSQRGVVNLFHSPAEREGWTRRYNMMRLNGTDAEVLTRERLAAMLPELSLDPGARYPVLGGVIQPRGGVARHDAVAWGYARAADRLGVDIIQNCEVTGFEIGNGRIAGVETTRGAIRAGRVGLCVAGHSGTLARLAGLRLPIETHLLQAVVTEPVKPFLSRVVSSGALRVYVSQTAKGEVLIGGPLDGYNSYSQRGAWPTVERILAGAAELYPRIRRLRLMRQWAGVMDMSMDGSPIISATPVGGLFLNGGWCYGGFKATPAAGWCMAHLLATGATHDLGRAFALDRFRTGHILTERGEGPQPHLH